MIYLAEARNVRGFVISDIFAGIKIRGIMPTAKTANLKCTKSFLGIQYVQDISMLVVSFHTKIF
jgi:hypothetical protein